MHCKKKTSNFYLDMQRNERVKYLEQTISWFRNEALKLAKGISEIKESNSKLSRQMDFVKQERDFLMEYTRSTKRKNEILEKTVVKLKDDVIKEAY